MVDVDPRDIKRPRYENYYPPAQHQPPNIGGPQPHSSSTPGPPPPPGGYPYGHPPPSFASRPPPPPHVPAPREPSREPPIASEPTVTASGPDVRLHGAPVNNPGRNFPIETRVPPNTAQGPPEMQRPPSGQGPPRELPPPNLGQGFPTPGPPIPAPGPPNMPPMEQPGPHVPFQPPPAYPPEQMPNGVGPNGFHVAHHAEGFHPHPPHFPQTQGPVMFAQYAAPTAGESASASKKRQTRAQVACTNCRAKKQRCDEVKPFCSYCKQNDLTCHYTDVAAPKADKQLNDLQGYLKDGFDMMQQTLQHFNRRFERIDEKLNLPPMDLEMQSPRKADPDPDSDTMEDVDEPKPLLGKRPPALHRHSIAEGMADPSQARPEFARPAELHGTPGVAKQSVDPDTDPLAEKRAVEETPAEGSDEHRTGVHHLVKEWKAIRDLFRACGIDSKNYASDSEVRQGAIRLYGIGQGRETDLNVIQSPSSTHPMEDVSPAPSGPDRDGLWGGLFQMKPNLDFRSGSSMQSEHIGGLNPDGSLNLDAAVVRRLKLSYLNTMHTLHPFLPADELNIIVESFIAHYSPQNSPRFVHAGLSGGTFEAAGMKRKHSSGGYTSRQTPDRTIKNAVVLLVMALGKMLEYTEWLPPIPLGPDEHPHPQSPWNHTSVESPPGFVRPSPPSSGSGYPSPMMDHHTPGSRRPSSGGLPPDRRDAGHVPYSETPRRNVDIIPGLAYFSHASGILGDHISAIGLATIRDVHAYLLGGLYMGQLCRPLQSHNMILMASRLCLNIVRLDIDCLRNEATEAYKPPKPTTPWKARDLENIKFVYWTCLQLEGYDTDCAVTIFAPTNAACSDIRAEFDEFEASGITKYSSDIGFPHKVTPPAHLREEIPVYDDNSSPENRMIRYYSMQNYLRVQLNRVHSNLYTIDRKSMIYNSVKLQKVIYNGVILWRDSLQRLAPFMAWSDVHHLSTVLNDARIRGKFYGSGYVISRPYLHQAIHSFSKEQIDQLEPGVLSSQCEMLPDLPPFGSEITKEQTLIPKPEEVVMAAKCCLWFAQKSTTVFDGLKGRWLITNVHGTITAQFGNVLVLYAAHQSFLRKCIPTHELIRLMDRTIDILDHLSNLSNIMRINAMILKKARAIISGSEPTPDYPDTPVDHFTNPNPRAASLPHSANTSFGRGS
ncbi:hypothetical protein P152DRAFT_450732 [Eremomyces bilateralis CBS 781.70]|uniref:Zn(2)-C6 fungal-type domain-containing protein n=1 Tax=Eremomyces bilateralis CBS 781.70 TaxID=1392243 RepID=A0A6G1FXX7_9PEZI|nr:uncharacterized protein P152DRAFT_450732 [Eremomyces bilateralis CBS 781.70]KAF1810735.1 hypothetical protein P152DRAFT_450732 [Eremomyces bilateralis CBS 781.70]